MVSGAVYPKESPIPLVLHRIFEYKEHVSGTIYGTSTNVYMRYNLKTERRNPTLMIIPSMHSVARGRREYVGETYSRVVFRDIDKYDAFRQVNVSTVPRRRRTLPTVEAFFTPKIYDVSMIQDHLLSPFHRKNKMFYKYRFKPLADGTTQILFRPKVKNTQLMSGSAIADNATGRILTADFHGEYDMIFFTLSVQMGNNGVESLLPLRSDVSGKFAFVGNRIKFGFHTVYGLPTFLPDSIRDSHDKELIARLRPDSLSDNEKAVYHRYDSLQALRAADTTHVNEKHKPDFVKDVLWDMVGDNLVNRIKGNFGGKDKGYFRINPILNPLYFGYSERKGFVYKSDIRATYNFTPNRDISMRLKSSYAFKQDQLYLQMPLVFNYNKRRHAFLKLELATGQRISNTSIIDDIKDGNGEPINEHADTTRLEEKKLDEFRDTYVKMVNNYDLSDRWSIQGGFVYHRRAAVDKRGFQEVGRPYKYHSFAPMLQVQFRPRSWNGPVFTFNWERAFRVLQSDMEYEKYEFDASLIRHYHRLRALSLRLGTGVYTMKNSKSYFLDYSNFRNEYIRDGWNDDWSGNFQVLRSRYYNSSDFYLRSNLTYESPLMVLSRLPLVGKYVEIERIYTSGLITQNLHPYVECGYGFTNRLFSVGLFVAARNMHFDGVGCVFDIELFSKW